MSGLGAVSPVSGVRVTLSVTESNAGSAVYSGAILWTDVASGDAREASGNVRVATDPPSVEFHGFEGAPEPAVTFVRTLLRTTARSVSDARWPRRLTRWRDEG